MTAKDYTGIRNGKLTITHKTGKCQVSRSSLWQAQCDCGTVITVRPYTVINGSILSCGCSRRIDYSGVKRGLLTMVKPTGKTARKGMVVWEALCECGTYVNVVPNDIRGTNKSCGCMKAAHRVRLGNLARNNSEKNRKHTPQMATILYIWRTSYKDCDFDLFLKTSQMSCSYCGIEPSRTVNVANARTVNSERQIKEGNFTYNGLDRIDSTKGHTKENVVPCCTRCNYMKSNMTLEDFKSHITRIASHLKL